jgi:hypothetical protein
VYYSNNVIYNGSGEWKAAGDASALSKPVDAAGIERALRQEAGSGNNNGSEGAIELAIGIEVGRRCAAKQALVWAVAAREGSGRER